MKEVKIKDVLVEKISGEWGKAPEEDNGNVFVIRTANFTNSGKINFENIVRRTIPERKIITKRLKKGDIIIEKSGGSPSQPVGRVVYFDLESYDDYLCNNFTSILRPNLEVVYPRYLLYVLLANHKKGKTRKFQNKTTGIINLKLDKYLDSTIPLPSLTDQKRIAKVLSHCEQLIAWRKESIDLLDDYLEAVFLEMFGDPAFNPKGFKLRKLSEFYLNPKEGTKCGPFGSALKKAEYVSEGIPVWNMDNISKGGKFLNEVGLWVTREKYEQLKSYSTQNGDIIISRAGTVGKMCVLNSEYDESLISTNLIRLRLEDSKLLPIFFASLMNYFKGRVGRLKTGPDGGFTHMNTRILDNLMIPYPPIELQLNFRQKVNEVDSLKGVLYQSFQELKILYASLSQLAFKGELDLSKIEIDDEAEAKNEHSEQIDLSEVKSKKVFDKKAILKQVDKRTQKINIRNLSFLDYLEIPYEFIENRDNWMFDFTGMDEFYQFLLKDNFPEDSFTFGDIEAALYNFYYHKGNMDFDQVAGIWKDVIFKFLSKTPPLLQQIFDRETGRVKLKLTDEAFEA